MNADAAVQENARMHADDAHDDMLDKLRSDNFKGLVKSANDAQSQQSQQMCLGSDGSITKADPLTAYRHLGAQRRNLLTQEPLSSPAPSEDDELLKIRAARVAEMQQKQAWRASGHGKLRELNNEADFIGVVRPRERAVVLLSDSSSIETPEVAEALVELAQKHVEAQFCHLELEKAGILSHILDLDQGLPVIFVLKHGEVTVSLPPARLFQFSSATSPMFGQHLASLLRKVGGIGSGCDDANSDSGCDSGAEDMRRRRRR